MRGWYDRDGKPLVTADHDTEPGMWQEQVLAATKLFEDPKYRIVKQSVTAQKNFLVSTVWTGLDHSFGTGKPLIFETMVFHQSDPHSKRRNTLKEVDMERYTSEGLALAGHFDMVNKWSIKEAQTIMDVMERGFPEPGDSDYDEFWGYNGYDDYDD